jgi:protein SCO1/2
MSARRTAACVLAAAVALAACGGGDDTDAGIGADRELAGYRRDPAPVVGDLTLPDLTADGAEFALRADPGEILTVYFGYTNCPDFCPTTLSDVRLATRRMEPADAARIGLAMITVYPDRDLPVLADYVTRTDAVEVEVAHSTSLYAVDDDGEIVLTWQFGVPIDDLASDLTQLLAQEYGPAETG